MILLVTYSISEGKRDYSGLYQTLQSYPTLSWWHYLNSTWLIKTNETPSQLQARIKPYFDSIDDSLLITPVALDSYTGWLPQKAWDWIRENK